MNERPLPRDIDDMERDHMPTSPDNRETSSGPLTPKGWSEGLPGEHLKAAKRLRRKHGAGFLVYLEKYYFQHGVADIEEDFYETYVGSYDSLRDWMLDSYREFGWLDAVEEVIAEQGIPDGALEWDLDHFISAGNRFELFEVHEKGGQIHVFQP